MCCSVAWPMSPAATRWCMASMSPAMMADRSLARDIEAVHHLVAAGDIGHAIEATIPALTALRLGMARA